MASRMSDRVDTTCRMRYPVWNSRSCTRLNKSGSDIATVSRFFSRRTATHTRLMATSFGMSTMAAGSGGSSARLTYGNPSW